MDDESWVGYTEEEKSKLIDSMNDLPSMFYGEWGDWENTILRMAEIIQAKRTRNPKSGYFQDGPDYYEGIFGKKE